jgi:hypothetical protein
MALDDVNYKSDLLPDYRLDMHWNDSEVSCYVVGGFIYLGIFIL